MHARLQSERLKSLHGLYHYKQAVASRLVGHRIPGRNKAKLIVTLACLVVGMGKFSEELASARTKKTNMGQLSG